MKSREVTRSGWDCAGLSDLTGQATPAGEAGPEREREREQRLRPPPLGPSASLRAPPRPTPRHPTPASINLLPPPSPRPGSPTTRTPQGASSAPPPGARDNLRPRGGGCAGVTCGPGPPRSSGRGSVRSPCPPAASPARAGRLGGTTLRVQGRAAAHPSPGGVAVRSRRARPGNPSRQLPPLPGPPAPAALPDAAHRPPGGSRTGVSECRRLGSGAVAGSGAAGASNSGGAGRGAEPGCGAGRPPRVGRDGAQVSAGAREPPGQPEAGGSARAPPGGRGGGGFGGEKGGGGAGPK